MNAILIIGHAPLAHALRQCALHVFPDCGASLVAIDVQPNLSPEETLATARIAMEQLSQPAHIKGILVLTDIFGATPSNVAQKVVDGLHSKLVAGVNLPMLLRTMNYSHESLDALVARALVGGAQCIMQVSVTAPQNQTRPPNDHHTHDHHQ